MAPSKITDQQILALRSEAGEASDLVQVHVCDVALGREAPIEGPGVVMTYKQALRAARKAGAANATGDALLAQHASVLVFAHPGLSAELLYNGARGTGVQPDQLRKLSALELADLMFAVTP